MLDNVLVERVRADIFVRRNHTQLVAGHKPQERSFARTHGAIASHCPIEIALHLERYLAAVAATLVLQITSPLVSGWDVASAPLLSRQA
jgi:hypothetical protein